MHAIRTAADAELVQLACAWADAHPDLDGRGAPHGGPPADHSLGTARHDQDEDADHDPLIPAMDGARVPRSRPRWGCPPRPARG